MKRIVIVGALLAMGGCSAIGSSLGLPDVPMEGTWKGNLDCPTSSVERQDMTIVLHDDSTRQGFMYGTVENNVVSGGRKGLLRYNVAGSQLFRDIKLEPKGQVLVWGGNFYANNFVAKITDENSMVIQFCGQNKTFTRVTNRQPAAAGGTASR
ncbi:hypothetical protein NK553_15700 [Pseudomonas sp. ZM23]|uniref:Lipoprotein n=1 Tax=Pseudomonas triclosanedens TaxID=2961893 RepID=A0ABY6ZVN5_9PSED|nr:hypothetical protein [Pseudomonas triclosanedens]MCP8465394.1 hypothetical protein [Pseudomonas triclosanedens]MCP8470666.1 hypothetical protein [Pseudomonas triclosanedens]MCP8476693.1 hypothetical protein [Pseudomonas triclosanedens]WAI48854.1 hypothetical protein OU419_24395 [Pseudomonas triclosanedens]